MKLVIFICSILTLILSNGADSTAQTLTDRHTASITTTVSPNPVINGNCLLLVVDTRRLKDSVVGIQAKFRGGIIPIFQHPAKAGGIFIGLIGISYYSEPGVENIKLEWTNRGGYHDMPVQFEIVSGKYKKESLRVPKQKVTPSAKDQHRISNERKELKAIYASGHPTQLWRTGFQRPANSKITSPFGTRRLLNGKMKSYHSGVDFRAPVGTPVYAANDGIVRFAKELFYSGNHLIVDHGMGVFTGYSHLSEFSVEPEQYVSKGHVIGRAGSTGRSNGPHLHWGAKVNGVSVNPLQLAEILQPLFPPQAQTDVTTISDQAPSQ